MHRFLLSQNATVPRDPAAAATLRHPASSEAYVVDEPPWLLLLAFVESTMAVVTRALSDDAHRVVTWIPGNRGEKEGETSQLEQRRQPPKNTQIPAIFCYSKSTREIVL